MLPNRPAIFSFWLLTAHEKWDYEQGCFALKICFECAFLQGNRHAIRRLFLLHMTMQSAKENELLWPYFLKRTVNKWMRNSVVTVNVTKTPHKYKIQYRYLGQGKTWLVDILMGQGFIGCRRCTLTKSTVLTINMTELMSLCACVQTEKKQEREQDWRWCAKEKSKRKIPQAEESSCYLDLLLPRFHSMQNHC